MFAVKGELARTPTGLEDAAMMQAAENAVLGQAPRGEAAAVMQSASRRKGRLGVVPRDEATDAAADGWVAVTEARVPGFRVKHARSSWPTRCRPFRVDATVALNCLKPSVRHLLRRNSKARRGVRGVLDGREQDNDRQGAGGDRVLRRRRACGVEASDAAEARATGLDEADKEVER